MRYLSRTPAPPRATIFPLAAALLVIGFAAGCRSTPAPGDPLVRRGDEISVCGQLFHTGTPVVLWNDPGGYDAYRVEPRFPAEMAPEDLANWQVKAHYHTLRNHVPDDVKDRVLREGWTVGELARYVDLFVIHYDASGLSRQCFKTLQDRRGLSVHFMLDVDGTVYQTLDLKERAWHAAQANDRSIGIEIANVGAYPDPQAERLTEWYVRDETGWFVRVPDAIPDPGVRTEGFVARPASPALISGPAQGKVHYQYDFTDRQYEALARLAAALARIFPRIALDVPRDAAGRVRTDNLSPEEFETWSGLIGHVHISDRKVDPGPAFDWERFIERARELAD